MKANSNKRNDLERMAKITRKSNEPTEIIKLLLLNYMLLGGASSGDIKNSHLWKMPHLVSPEESSVRTLFLEIVFDLTSCLKSSKCFFGKQKQNYRMSSNVSSDDEEPEEEPDILG